MKTNETSLDTLCAALDYAMGLTPPAGAAPANPDITGFIDSAFSGRKADRIFLYNPDAIAQWIYEKYPQLFLELDAANPLKVPFRTVMPSVTPVCFGTFYTGMQPAVHGIQKYEKPVIRVETFFDTLIRAGKRPVIVADVNCSMGKIFRERDMDYFVYDSYAKINAKAAELILADQYDAYIIYNGNYDNRMHKTGPESLAALSEIRMNVEVFAMFTEMIREHWKAHDTFAGFAMDHGCHEIDGDLGSHGLDMPEDLNIMHFYTAYPAAV